MVVPHRADAARLTATETAISIRGLTKCFPVPRALRDALRHPLQRDVTAALCGIDCEVRRGEFFGLLGPNGAGKTTLAKILATLTLPDAGSVRVAGFDVVDDASRVRRVLAPVIADERSLHWRLSASENLRLFAVLQEVRSAALQQRVTELLDVVGLGAEGPKPVGAFSSGMRQRLLIARALIAEPQVLLLDEPTRSLDPISARDFRAFLRSEIADRRGCTVVLTTHNTEEALQLCDRVAILNRGRILATGAPEALRDQFGDERYRLWTRGNHWLTWSTLAELGATCNTTPESRLDGWSVVEVDVPGGPTRVSDLLRALIGHGVAIARCERIELSLADLIDRVLRRA
ncbi:MAG TPA: ABC transporter ATP-binding protein [Gemmatimonadales bacterium]|nr:ABC transporter ATP-binding protein [Gemmatimonadales bacterium]